MIKSDNSVQMNIKITFTVDEYIIVYEYIWIYSSIQFDDAHTGFTFIWFCQMVLLVETAYTIVNMIQVITKEARAT